MSRVKEVLPVLLKDGYKVGHIFQYPKDTKYVYSNFTPRSSRTGFDYVMFFGLQYFLIEYLQHNFNENFFSQPKERVLKAYKRRIDNYLGKDAVTTDHIAKLHDLGYLPLKIKAIAEGTLVPMNVPVMTIVNTKPEFFWLTNMLETLLSNILWKPCTSATTAFRYRRAFEKYARETGGPLGFVGWQAHDFSYRGMAGSEDAMLSGAAHLLSSFGTDTIPAIDLLEEYYGADSDKELVGGSVPATEHSVMSMGSFEKEEDTYRRLLTEVYPKGIVSIVSDTWDFWSVIYTILPKLKDVILARDGKLVIRPDSGDPVDIICGTDEPYVDSHGTPILGKEFKSMGAIRSLWEIFGGKVNEAGYKELDSHIGLIYGDSITLERQEQILSKLKAKGFASTNIVLGIGSYTYAYVTRDTYGFAMKATWGETESRGEIEIFKNPKTDADVGGSHSKKSHKGLLSVRKDENGKLYCKQQCSKAEEAEGLLETVFENGKLTKFQTLSEIRKRVEEQL
jgi:nicotinamide phosphoribosyltransferase